MSTLDGACQRLERALASLETALRDSQGPLALPSENETMLARDLELLRAECDGLRRALDEALTSQRTLADTVGEVTDKLDRTIGELAEIVAHKFDQGQVVGHVTPLAQPPTDGGA